MMKTLTLCAGRPRSALVHEDVGTERDMDEHTDKEKNAKHTES